MTESPTAKEWKAFRYEETYRIKLVGRVLEDGRSVIRATLGDAKNPVAVGDSVSELLPDGSTKMASIQEALQNLASQLTGK